MQRRHDIDALRAFAFGLLILYHLSMLYVSDWSWHLKSTYQSETLQIPMLFVNRWRMDLIFLISGISTAFLLRQKSVGAFLRERSARLLIPLLFGILVIVPIQPYCQGVANGLVEPGFLRFLGRYFTGYHWPANAFAGWERGYTWNHLWYLAYLWCYTVLLAILHVPLTSRAGRALGNAFTDLVGWRLLVWPFVPLLIYTVTLQLRFPQNNALLNDWYAHAMYFTMFLYGWWLGNSDTVWPALVRIRKHALAVSLTAYAFYTVVRTYAPEDGPPVAYLVVWVLRNLYIWTMLCAILGFAHEWLNRPFRWLPYTIQAVYPWYILHQSIIVGLAYWLVPMKLGAIAEPLLVGGGTVLGCWVLTSCLITKSPALRPLFGLRQRDER